MALTLGYERFVRYQENDEGSTSLVVPDGRLDNIAVGVPPGLDWLSDTLHGFDIYAKGFVRTPTLFFDPTATTSAGRGTLANPYTTQAELQAAINGDMRGHILGMKRGTTLNVTGSGLVLTCYGAADEPFMIVPYGDAEALPIISGHASHTWTVHDAGLNIWKVTLATERDVWQDGTRLWKKVWNTDAATTLSSEGFSTYNAGTLYIRPRAGVDPSADEIYSNGTSYALKIGYSDVAASGYVSIVGMDCRYAAGIGLIVEPETVASASTTTIADVEIVGNRVSKCGIDDGGSAVGNAITVYGAADAKRITNMYVAGNETFDALHNALEVRGISGGVVEHNYSHEIGALSIIELWSSCDNVHIRYNYGKNAYLLDSAYNSAAGQGVWYSNYAESAGTWDTNDATNAKNHDNWAYFNLIENFRIRAFKASGGTGQKFVHNTCICDSDAVFGAGVGTVNPSGWYTEGNAATGFCDISNNIFYFKATTAATRSTSFGRVNTAVGAAASVPSGDKNLYVTQDGWASGSWWATDGGFESVGDDVTGNFTTWRTVMSAYGLDANSLANSDNLTNGNVTLAQIGMDETTFTPLAANLAGVTTLTGIGTRYKDGVPYSAASATIGAFLGS